MSEIIRTLEEDYERLVENIRDMYAEVRAKHRAAEKEEKAARRVDLEKEFAVKFELARASGVKRYQLEEVLRTKDGNKYRHFVELGGGELTRLRSRSERVSEREELRLEKRRELLEKIGWEELGVRSDGEIWYQNQNGLEFWLRYDRNGRPYGVIDESIHPPERWQEIHHMMREHKDEIREIKEGEVK